MSDESVAIGLGCCKGKVLHESRIDLVEDRPITAIDPEVPGDDRQGGIPGRAVAPRKAPARRRHDARDISARQLRIDDVPEPLLVGCRIFEDVLRQLARD